MSDLMVDNSCGRRHSREFLTLFTNTLALSKPATFNGRLGTVIARSCMTCKTEDGWTVGRLQLRGGHDDKWGGNAPPPEAARGKSAQSLLHWKPGKWKSARRDSSAAAAVHTASLDSPTLHNCMTHHQKSSDTRVRCHPSSFSRVQKCQLQALGKRTS